MKPATKFLDLTLTQVSTKSANQDEVIIEGYANTSSKDRVGDVVVPTAFEKSLPVYLKNPVLLENHDWTKIVGRVLEAKITDKGLYVKARISDTRPDIKTLVKEKCLSTFSIGYNEIDADLDESTKTKYIKDLELLEISIVTVPANHEASFAVSEAKVEDKPATEEKIEKSATKSTFRAFVTEVKEARGSDLSSEEVLALTEYYVSSEDIMTKKELIELLSKKEAVSVVAEPNKEEKAPPAPDAQPAAQDPMKMVMDKLDAIAMALSKLLEDEQSEAQEDAAEEPADEAQPADDSQGQPADAQKAEPCKCAAPAPSEEKELSDEEIEKSLGEIEAQLVAVDDEING